MATDLQHDQDTGNVTGLMAGIVADGQALVKQEIQLLKHEVREDILLIKAGAILLGLAAAIGIISGVLLGAALAYGLGAIWPELPLWACFAIAGCILAVFGAALAGAGWAQLKSTKPISLDPTVTPKGT
jgi:Putative Actinobacterial Holin-X, holin superfamily III